MSKSDFSTGGDMTKSRLTLELIRVRSINQQMHYEIQEKNELIEAQAVEIAKLKRNQSSVINLGQMIHKTINQITRRSANNV